MTLLEVTIVNEAVGFYDTNRNFNIDKIPDDAVITIDAENGIYTIAFLWKEGDMDVTTMIVTDITGHPIKMYHECKEIDESYIWEHDTQQWNVNN